jgi:hypothetical protein
VIAAWLQLPGPDHLPELRLVQVELNGTPGIGVLAYQKPITAMALEIADERGPGDPSHRQPGETHRSCQG